MPSHLLFDTSSGSFLTAGNWSAEKDIDQTVLQYPELVSQLLSDGEDYAVSLAGKGLGGPQLLEIDALFLLDNGNEPPRLVVWESKLEGNVQPRRIVGQVVDYASALAALPSEAFRKEIAARMAQPSWRQNYEEYRRRRRTGIAWEEIERRAVEAHGDGRFVLAICAENLPDDVIRMLEWLDRKMPQVMVHPLALGPVGNGNWVQAAALLSVLRGGDGSAELDAAFDAAVRRLALLGQSQVIAVTTAPVHEHVLRFVTSGPVSARPNASGAWQMTIEQWRAEAQPEMLAVYERLASEFGPPTGHWFAKRAVMLNLVAGETTIEGLRLFSNRAYFVSKKDLERHGTPQDVAWWRSAVARFPVNDPSAKHPVVPMERLGALVAQLDELVAVLHEMRKRVLQASSG